MKNKIKKIESKLIPILYPNWLARSECSEDFKEVWPVFERINLEIDDDRSALLEIDDDRSALREWYYVILADQPEMEDDVVFDADLWLRGQGVL